VLEAADLEPAALEPGDLVGVRLPPGPVWRDLIARVWDAGAALLPIDVRLTHAETDEIVRRAQPTVLLDEAGRWRRSGRSGRSEGVPAEGGIVAVIHTSGTAGPAKLVEFDRHAIDAAVASSALALEAGPHDRWLCCLPVAHVGGLLVVVRAVLLGAPVTVHERFEVETFERERDVAFVSVVPTMLVRLLDAGADLARFRAILVGGAALPELVRRRAEEAGARLVETYGLTETCGGVVYDGRPLPGTSLRLDPLTHGIELIGPTLMRGYRYDPSATEMAFTADGWLRPGDAGRFDDDGRLRVLGRLDDLIDTGGEKVWPQQVEAALATHPAVAEVAVAGRPDPEWGQRVVAFVVPSDPASPPSLRQLRDHVAAAIARFKAPRELILLDALPRTSSDKVRRSELARRPQDVRAE
jgi:o-succinylbenzoate---CoA ligase